MDKKAVIGTFSVASAGVIAEHGCKDVKECMQKSPWYREFELGREAEKQLKREREWER